MNGRCTRNDVTGKRIAARADRRVLAAVAGELAWVLTHVVRGLREFGYSWAEIAARTGTTRQAAQQRWGKTA